MLARRTKGRVHYTFSKQQKSHVRNIYTVEEKLSIILHSFARKTKVSYYITFFQTLLKTFSCGLCYSHRRIILSYCEKRKVNYDVCKRNKRASTLYFQRPTVVSCYKYLHCRGKIKYHITFFCEKNKSIILHHVLPNSPENIFLRPLFS